MDRILIKDIDNYFDKQVTVKGWVETIRDQKKMQFLVLRDHSGKIQLTNMKKDDETTRNISKCSLESCVTVTGVLVKAPNVKLGQKEIFVESFEIENLAEPLLPLDVVGNTEDVSLDHRLDWRYLDLRKPDRLLIFQVQTTAEMAMREFWVQNGYIELHSPKLTGNATESGSEVFCMEYFDTKAYLAQSPQFYKQMAMSAGFDKVFEIGSVFRAEPSFTSRHATEFVSIDMEISWTKSHHEVMDEEEKWIKYFMQKIKEKHGKEIKEVFGEDIHIPEGAFPRIALSDAIKVLETEMGYQVPKKKKGDLDPEGERLLCEWAKKKHNSDFIFVIDYPVAARPFYHMRHKDDRNLTMSFDLLWKGLELTTGAQREHRYEILKKQVEESGMSVDGVQFYLDFFKYGCPPHGGLGFGLSRFLMKLLGLPSIKESTFLFRGPNRLFP
ncbi:MAG: aspartate--tRNA(Asn) ligase [Bacillota bacterium]|jgi:nondiscriminating aspartyl-tRNA synthetase|nr:aspartate--tRNA(Asn) ligase [Bacillota bacterium]HHU43933.1 aspartate--tRNA(Asn) ligase [Clostridiales bacterium]